ncbi:serine/threonine-protein kinase [Nocardia sp. NPDC058705]|uniref:serine/threonine-protein kinase n=1 Tax=Nocardia sp. NPDC058705 TaxID=3346609 RepID=UPI003684E9ED
MNLRPGAVFAGYLIERVLGSGGMGTVYAARHPRLPRLDALKVLSEIHSAEPEFRARFIREAELAARIDHPNVVAVHDRGLDEGALWMTMRLVAGTDAAALLRTGPPDPLHAVHIVTEAAAGLDAAHRAGLLHRDVKPANLMLERRPGEPDRVLVADFGIAKAGADSTALTEAGTFVATLAYAAPEVIVMGHVDHRADVYALGCTLFELLTGRKPFPRETPAAVIAAHLYEPPPHPTDLNPDLPPDVDAVLTRALAKDRDARYSTCGALAAATNAAFGTPVAPTARAPHSAPPLPPDARSGSASRPTAISVSGQAATSSPVSVAPNGGPGAQAPGSTRRPRARLTMALTAAICLSVVLVGVVVANRDAGTVTQPPTPPTTTVATEQGWERYQYVANALPTLLPSGPFASGYQGIRCVAVDREHKPVPLNQHPDRVGTLTCNGDRNPVERISANCNADRTPTTAAPLPENSTVLDEPWERSSSRGRVIVQDAEGLTANTTVGVMFVTFEDVARNFCILTVYGGASGRDLYDRWWPYAPL